MNELTLVVTGNGQTRNYIFMYLCTIGVNRMYVYFHIKWSLLTKVLQLSKSKLAMQVALDICREGWERTTEG
jgi:hypothetical protein